MRELTDEDVISLPPYFGRVAREWVTAEAAPRPKPLAPVGEIIAADLQGMEFPPVRFVVDGYVAEGLTIFAGKPKIGKSW